MATQSEPFRDPKSGSGAATPRPVSALRAAWAPPKIVRHGSVRHLVRGISGFLTDTFGMPGMRKT